MRARRYLAHLVLPLLLAACSADEAPGGGFPFDCQPLCQDSNGNILGASMDLTIKANDSDEAASLCLDAVRGSNYCPAADTIPRCSCDLSSGSGS
jgi:hypothetical protein